MEAARFRNICFTDNKCEIDHQTLGTSPRITYLVLQKEAGDEKKHPHFQGYCEFKNPITLNGIKKLFKCPHLHIEARRGTAKQASDYCKKADSRIEGPWEYGAISEQGKRSDLTAVANLVKEKHSIREVAEAHPETYIKYFKGIERLNQVLNKPPNRYPVKLISFTGRTGLGKSLWTRRRFPEAFIWTQLDTSNSKNWWMDGYNSQSVIILEEYTGWIPLPQLLMLLDGCPMTAPIKGGAVNIAAQTVIILSNFKWQSVYSDNHQTLQRRIDEFGTIYDEENLPEDFYDVCPELRQEDSEEKSED